MLKQKKNKNYLRRKINYNMYLNKRKHKLEYLKEKKHSLFQGSR